MNPIYFMPCLIRSSCRCLFFTLNLVVLVSCSPANHQVAGKNDKKDSIYRKPTSSFSDTVMIDFAAAVFYNSDSLQLEKIESVTDKMIFESNVHDCFYQMRNARIVLKNHYPHVRIVEVKNARYLLFKKNGGEKQYIDLNTKNDQCGLFIFDAHKAPELTDMTNLDTQLESYFAKTK